MLSAGRCKKGFVYDAYSTDSSANCIGVTSKFYAKDASVATSACSNKENSNVATGAQICNWSFRKMLKVLKYSLVFKFNNSNINMN